MNYLLFAESDVETAEEAMLLPAGNYLGCDPVDGGVTLFFKAIDGTETREAVTLNCANGNQKEVLDAFVAIVNSRPHSDGFIIVADADVANPGSGATRTATFHKEFKGLVTGCTIA